jgi:hypothetical protein
MNEGIMERRKERRMEERKDKCREKYEGSINK